MNVQDFMKANEPSGGRSGVLTPFHDDIKALVQNDYGVKDIQKFAELQNVTVSYQVCRYYMKKVEDEIEAEENAPTLKAGNAQLNS